MHGLINRAIQCFVIDISGPEVWDRVVVASSHGIAEFETLLDYNDDITEDLLSAVGTCMATTRAALLEDIGTYLVTGPRLRPVRRLLRFGGVNFVEFLHSLDDLPDRVRLAVPDLVLPALELNEIGPSVYALCVGNSMPGFGRVLLGVIQAMADDYGVLAVTEHKDERGGEETLSVQLFDSKHASGNTFELLAERR